MIKDAKLIQTVLIATLVLLALSNNINAQKTFIIQGQVVDSDGKGISNSYISLDTQPCEKCFDQIIPSIETAGEGYFYFNVNDLFNIKNLSEVTLLIGTRRETKSVWNPFFPLNLTKLGISEFAGILVKSPRSGGIVNLGKISPTIDFTPVSINLSTLFDNGTDLLKMNIKYKEVKLRENILVPEKYISPKSSILKLMLPTGKWELNFEISNIKNKKRLSKVLIDVRENRQSIEYLSNACSRRSIKR